MKFMYFFNEKNDVLLKITEEIFQLVVCLLWLLEYLIKKFPVPTMQVTVILIKVKSWNALLHMLLVCNSVYLNSVLKYTFLILDSHNLDSIFTWAMTWGSMVIFQSQKDSLSKQAWKTLPYAID
jgi:hypothetical protein